MAVRILGGHFLDLHAARLRSHKHQLARRAIEHDAQVKLAVDSRSLLDQQPLHLLPLRPGLVRNQLHAEDVLGVQLGVFAGARHFHAAALAAAAGMNLRFHHHAACALGKQGARHGIGLFQRVGHFALRHGHAVLRQDFFRLILVNLHVGWDRQGRSRFGGFGAGPDDSGPTRYRASGKEILSCCPNRRQFTRPAVGPRHSSRNAPLP